MQIFKFMALYSQIQFTSMLILYYDYSQMNNQMFVYIDFFIVVPLAVSLSLIKPCQNLSIEKPNVKLISKKNITSIFSGFAL